MLESAVLVPGADVTATPARPDPLTILAETESRDADTLKKDRNIASVIQPVAFVPDVTATPARPDPLTILAETESRDADTLKKDRNIPSVLESAVLAPGADVTARITDPTATLAASRIGCGSHYQT